MIKAINNLQKGFTVIELLIYVVLFAIILSTATFLFFQSKTLEAQVVQNQVVEQNARVMLLEMTQTVRSVASVTSPVLGSSAAVLALNNDAIIYAVANGILQKTDAGQTYNITSDAVTVQNLTFTTRGQVGKPPTVSMSFTLKSNTLLPGQSDYIAKNYQTTIQLR